MTEERKPELWRARERVRSWLVEGIEVRPRRALDAFWRCEQTFARWTRDILRRGKFWCPWWELVARAGAVGDEDQMGLMRSRAYLAVISGC